MTNHPPAMIGPTFAVDGLRAGRPLKLIGYGDTRFTDQAEVKETNPVMRKFLVDQIAREAPDVLFETGDLPLVGSNLADWEVYRAETEAWRKQGLRIFPTIGNHEVAHDFDRGSQLYFDNFPLLRGCRYYSALIANVYLISLDGSTPIARDPRQMAWLASQLEHLPGGVDFVFILDHMPMLADLQSEVAVRLPGADETELRKLLERERHQSRAHYIVLSGHIHNYERFEREGITHIVTGGGGAKPYPIFVRGPEDLYRDRRFPVFNYVVFQLNGTHIDATMYRVKEPGAASPVMEVGERFAIDAQTR